MTDFERDVIDRLARIETEAKNTSRLGETLTLQGVRIDSLANRIDAIEKSIARVRDRTWGVIAVATLLVPQLVSYLRIAVFGNYHP